MSEFMNTVDLLGEDAVLKALIEDTLTEFNDDTVPIAGDYSFRGCSLLKRVNLPSVVIIGKAAFYNCTSLVDVKLPRWKTTSALESVFENCSSLSVIDLPKVTMFGSIMFKNCVILKNIVLRSETICTISHVDALDATPFASDGTGGRCLVPRALIESYQTATNWSTLYAAGTCTFLALEDYTVDGTITGEIDWDKLNG